jgi:predicted nucleic acid-binding protein
LGSNAASEIPVSPPIGGHRRIFGLRARRPRFRPAEKVLVAASNRGRVADGRSGLDAIIAAVAEANDCIVVTDNEKDFEGIEIVNPLRGAV